MCVPAPPGVFEPCHARVCPPAPHLHSALLPVFYEEGTVLNRANRKFESYLSARIIPLLYSVAPSLTRCGLWAINDVPRRRTTTAIWTACGCAIFALVIRNRKCAKFAIRPAGGGAGGSVVASSVDGVVACPPPRRARSPRVHGSRTRTVNCAGVSMKQATKYRTKSRLLFILPHTCESCELRPVCSRSVVSIQCCFDSIFSGPSGTKQQTAHAHANVRGPYVRLPCTLPMPAARMRPCPIWPHAIQRNWTPSAPEMGPRFPMWNRDSLHARNSRVLSWTSITRRQAAGAYHQNLPLPAPPSHPSTFPGASLAEAAIQTTRRWDSSRGIISACICLHLPAPPCISNRRHRRQSRRSSRRQSSCHAALITAPYGLMSSVRHRPPSAQPPKRPVQPPDKPSACRSLQIIIDGCCLLIVIGVPQNVSLSSSRRRATACSPPRQRGSRAHRSHKGRPDGRGS